MKLAVGLVCLASAALADFPATLRADWLREAAVRGASGGPVTSADDAAGLVDGRRDEEWGNHTLAEPEPWWQVDLGASRPLRRIVVYNRPGAAASRTSRFRLLLADDPAAWRVVYQHDGTVFDREPVTVTLTASARFVRVQLPGTEFLHLNEVEVYGPDEANLAFRRPADQSSVSQWSRRHDDAREIGEATVRQAVERGRRLVADHRRRGAPVADTVAELDAVEAALAGRPDAAERLALYLQTRATVRRQALRNPLLDFDRVLFLQQVPGRYSHMSDQNYGWWSRPGGGLFVLEGFRSGEPRLRCLTDGFPPGSFASPELSYDGTKVLFAWCRADDHVAGVANKVEKAALPEDAFYHLFEMNVDGTGLRQLTRGRWDDFDGRYLPDGQIVFLSTRRGTALQGCGPIDLGLLTAPDSYVRCGGGASRPVAVYTLHQLTADGSAMRCISAFESFEWTPSVAADGRILYARWDYVDRDNMPYMGLWSARADGTNPQAVYGNYTRSPHAVFEARSIPGSRKIIFTASAHHSITGGSLVLLDPARGVDGPEPLERLTPDVVFPEIDGWPSNYYRSPWPLDEDYYLTAWSPLPLSREGQANPPNALGIYLFDRWGNLDLLSRDESISSLCPLPLRPRPAPPTLASRNDWSGSAPTAFLVADVYAGLPAVERGAVKALRVVAMPLKVQPQMNLPSLGVTRDDPGKCVLGTTPVEADGSAHFQVPAGVPVFFQALDGEGRAIQTMRSLTYGAPGETLSCVGCHESRLTAAPARAPLAARRAPSRLTPGPEGSWPLDYGRLVQPVLDRACVDCHRTEPTAAKWPLTADKSYETLLDYGRPSLREHVALRYREGRSVAGAGPALTSPLLRLLDAPGGHHGALLSDAERARLSLWLDTYGQRQGHFSTAQAAELTRLKELWAGLFD